MERKLLESRGLDASFYISELVNRKSMDPLRRQTILVYDSHRKNKNFMKGQISVSPLESRYMEKIYALRESKKNIIIIVSNKKGGLL